MCATQSLLTNSIGAFFAVRTVRFNCLRTFCVLLFFLSVFDSATANELAKVLTDPSDRATFEWLLERAEAEPEIHYRRGRAEWIGFKGESRYTCGLVLDEQGRVVKALFNKQAIDNEELKKLAGFKHLQHINCQHNFGMDKGGPGAPRGGQPNVLSGAGWIAFKNHPLESMRLAGSPFDGDGLRAVAQIKELKTLNVFHTAVTDDDIAALRGHPNLEEVVVGPMWDDKITNTTVEHVSHIPNLKRFKVVETYMCYDAGLEHLAKLDEQIEEIDLGNTVVPPADLERLRKELPRAKIAHEPIPEIGQLIIENWKGADRKLREWAPAEVIDTYVTAAEADAEEVGEFSIPEVSPLDVQRLQTMRQLVKEHPEAAALADSARRDALPLLNKKPQPLKEIHYEGLVNTDPQRIASVAKLKDMADVARLLRYWQVSGDQQAAQTLKRYILAWTETYRITGNDVNENKFHPLLSAYYSLREQFSEAQRDRVDAWVEALGEQHAQAVKESQHFTNRYTKHVRLTAVCGMILRRDEWVEVALDGIRRFVTESLYPDGTSEDLKRRDALGYHVSGLRPPLELAMLLGDRGSDLYAWQSPRDGSLKNSVEQVLPYAIGEKVHQEWVNTKVGLDKRRAAAGIEKYQPGKEFEPRDSLKLMETAAYFDPALLKVVRHLSEDDAERFPTWQTLVNATAATAESRNEGLP